MKNRMIGDDSFWDVSHLMPRGERPIQRSNTPKTMDPSKSLSAPPKKPSASDLQKEAPCPKKEALPRRERLAGEAIPRGNTSPSRLYEPACGAICRVEIYPWPNHYTFFSGFQKNALAILEMPAEKAPVVPFFSFMPQYHQLTAVQLRFYLYWRKCFYEGLYLHADLSYLLLFVYEVINLPAKIPPKGGIKLLLRLWSAYRKTYPKLDKYLAEWVCDYCLVHGIDRSDIPRPLAAVGRKNCSLPEFYIGEGDEHSLLSASGYDFKKSRFYTAETKDVFEKHIKGALLHLEETMAKKGDARFVKAPKSPQRITRTSFDGAVCVYSEKKRIEVVYTPQSEQTAGGFATDAVKFCENRVRAALGIRSRFSTPSLQGDMRLILEQYFDEHLPAPAKKKGEDEAEYDSRYEPESRGFSAEESRRIEEQSLEVARRLGSVFEEEEEQPFFTPAPFCPNAETKAPSLAATEPAVPLERTKKGLAILLEKGHDAFLEFAKKEQILPASLAEQINEEALCRLGDVALEEADGRYTVIEEYKEEVTLWINS